jgi:hypothetical protein
VVVTVGAVAMTAFLWHLTALYVAVLGLRLLGRDRPEPATLSWWVTRPPWLLVLAVLTLGLIAVFRRFDSMRPATGGALPRLADILTALGAGLAALGVLMVSVTGIDVVGSAAVRFVVFNVTPLAALSVLAAGVAAIALSRRLPQRALAAGQADGPAAGCATTLDS